MFCLKRFGEFSLDFFSSFWSARIYPTTNQKKKRNSINNFDRNYCSLTLFLILCASVFVFFELNADVFRWSNKPNWTQKKNSFNWTGPFSLSKMMIIIIILSKMKIEIQTTKQYSLIQPSIIEWISISIHKYFDISRLIDHHHHHYYFFMDKIVDMWFTNVYNDNIYSFLFLSLLEIIKWILPKQKKNKLPYIMIMYVCLKE